MPVMILAYHGVTDLPSSGIENFQDKHLVTATFEEQVRTLSELGNVLRLRDLVDAYQAGQEIDGVVITFDDGYRNNGAVALPILERYGVPATFFLSTGFIGNDRMFWVDEVEQAVDQTDASFIDLTSAGLRRFALDTLERRMEAVTDIKAHLKRMPDESKARLLCDVKRTLPARPGSRKASNYETLSWDEVRQIARSALVDLGAHTVDHAILSRLPMEKVREQVVECKRALETETGREVTLFAYPNGGAADYTPESIAILKEAGYTCACTTLPGTNTRETSLFELRRPMVGFCGEPFPFPMSVGIGERT